MKGTSRPGVSIQVERAVAGLVVFLTVIWAGYIYFSQRAAGVWGNDPATYVQMALDIAHTGSPLHDFMLIRQIDLSGVEPFSYVQGFMTAGYFPGCDFCSWGTPKFPAGLPSVLALAYRSGGETALFLVPPLIGGLALLVTWYLAYTLMAHRPAGDRSKIAAMATLVLALSWSQTTLSLVPRSDVPAQLFLLIAVTASLKMGQADRLVWPIATGLALGMAYHMRHPTALLLLICIPLAFYRSATIRSSWLKAGCVAGTFIVVIFPDLLYHHKYLGGFWKAENPESLYLAWKEVPRTMLRVALRVGSAREFGLTLPLMVVGCVKLWQERAWRTLWVVGGWFGYYLVFHLPLELTGQFDNASRFFLPAFPALAVPVAYSLVAGCPNLSTLVERGFRTVVFGLFALFLLQKVATFPPAFDCAAGSYGLLTHEQRQVYEHLNETLPENAVVAVSEQQVGAVQMYVRRPTVRPWIWTPEQFTRFADEARAQNWPIYLFGAPGIQGQDQNEADLPAYLSAYRPVSLGEHLVGLPSVYEPTLYRID